MRKAGKRATRREFFGAVAASAIGAGLAPGLQVEAQEAQAIKSTVGIARDPSIAKAVLQAVEMAGGMDFIKPGQRVLIKPNQVLGVPHPVTTHPEVLYEVAKLAAEAGSETIFISDRCWEGQDPATAMEGSGHLEAARQAESDIGGGVKVISVGLDEAAEYMKPGSPTWREIHHPLAKRFIEDDGRDVGFNLAEFLFQVDHVINVPCCKVHLQAWLSMSMKNCVGMSDATTRRYFHSKEGSPSEAPKKYQKKMSGGRYFTTLEDTTGVSRSIAELNLVLAPSLNIIDGIKPIYHGSHVSVDSDSAKADTIIASRDRVAADVAGVALIRAIGNEERWKEVSPWEHPMIIRAGELGLGVTKREDITVKHKGVDNIETLLEKMV